jgi:hypothetical protein
MHKKGSFTRHQKGIDLSICEECEKSVAIMRCEDCEMRFCRDCSSEMHSKGSMRFHEKAVNFMGDGMGEGAAGKKRAEEIVAQGRIKDRIEDLTQIMHGDAGRVRGSQFSRREKTQPQKSMELSGGFGATGEGVFGLSASIPTPSPRVAFSQPETLLSILLPPAFPAAAAVATTPAAKIAELEGRLAHHETLISKQKSELEERDVKIRRLQNTIRKLTHDKHSGILRPSLRQSAAKLAFSDAKPIWSVLFCQDLHDTSCVDGGTGDDVVFEDGIEFLDVLGVEEVLEDVSRDLGEGLVGGGEDACQNHDENEAVGAAGACRISTSRAPQEQQEREEEEEEEQQQQQQQQQTLRLGRILKLLVNRQYCSATEICALLCEYGLCNWAEGVFQVEVAGLDGTSVQVSLDSEHCDVSDVTNQIELTKGIKKERQVLHFVDVLDRNTGKLAGFAPVVSLGELKPGTALDVPCLLSLYIKPIADASLLETITARDSGWDLVCKGRCIKVSGKTSAIASCTSGTEAGGSIRSKIPLLPKSGIHIVEYVYVRPYTSDANGEQLGGGVGGENLGSGYIVGVTNASLPSDRYAHEAGVLETRHWWGLADAGRIFEGSRGNTRWLCASAMNLHERAFGSGDRIGFMIDMNRGVMTFVRNGQVLPGSRIQSLPVDEPLYLVASPYDPTSAVVLAKPAWSNELKGAAEHSLA